MRLLWVFLFVLGSCSVSAQPPLVSNPNNLITLTVTVTTPQGRIVGGLTKEDLTIVDEKLTRPIRFFGAVDEPLDVGILVDTSESMNMPAVRRIAGRDQIIESLSTFIQLSNQKNDYFLMSFGSQLHLISDWTTDLRPLLGRIPVAHDKTNTSFYDALWAAVEKVKTGRNRTRVVLVVSDGIDNGSRHKLNDVRDFLKANDVLVYSLAVTGYSAGPGSLSGMPAPIANIVNARITSGGRQALINFAEITGGLALFVDETTQMNLMANRIATELRHQYRVEFESDSLKPGKWRRLKAMIKPRANSTEEFKKLRLRTRQGYYSGADRIKRD